LGTRVCAPAWRLHAMEPRFSAAETEEQPLVVNSLGTDHVADGCLGARVFTTWLRNTNMDSTCHCCSAHIAVRSLMVYMLMGGGPDAWEFKFVKQADPALQQALEKPIANLSGTMRDQTVPVCLYCANAHTN
jgi:hypothetical protein